MDNVQKIVIILGMHRSGTSMIGGILECLEVDLGDDQPGKQWSNPLGHFEDPDFLSLNKKILASAGGSWSNPPSYLDISNLKEEYYHDIQALIQERANKSANTPWGWKDPRTSLTLDLFLPFLDQPYIIWCSRDPNAISQSLQKRNQIQPSISLDLTEYYNNQINEFMLRNPNLPILVVDYEGVIKDPEIWINKIVRHLGLRPDTDLINQAVNLVLAPGKLRREKWLVRVGHLITAPIRLLKRIKGNTGC